MTEQQEQVLKMYDVLRTSAKNKQKFFRLLKDEWPNLQIPELDAADQASEMVKSQEQKLEEMERRLLERDVRDRLETERNKLRRSPFNLTDREIGEVEKLMQDKGLPTHEIAGEWYLKVSAPSKPSGFMGSIAPGGEEVRAAKDLIKDPESELHKNPKKWSSNEFDKAWSDIFETGKVQFQ